MSDPHFDQELDQAFALHQALRFADAQAAYQRILAQAPNHPDALHLLGVLLVQRGHPAPAADLIRRAIGNHPEAGEYHLSLGVALMQQGDPASAIQSFQTSLQLNGPNPQATFHLAAAYQALGQLDEAVAWFGKALELDPNNASAATNLAVALDAQGLVEEALVWYQRAVELDPTSSAIHSNLPYALYFDPRCDARTIRREHDIWRARHADPLKHLIQPHRNDRDPNRRLRIGFISPDFRQHVVSVFMLPLLAEIDRRDFEVTCYSSVAVPDHITAQIRAKADRWHDIARLSDDEAAQQIRDDAIDILIDLSLHMAGNRLLVLARKPAPVQVTYLGYAGTTGLDTIDYRLTDPQLDPPHETARASFYTEQSHHLPHTYWGYRAVADAPVAPLPALQSGSVTFGCLNNPAKVNSSVLALWSRVLSAIPSARLLLHSQQGSHRARIIQTFRSHGISPDRIGFSPFLPVREYHQLFNQIDIALDPFPCGGGTSTFDALWMGVPVVTLAGQTAVGRAGVSICSNVGLPELVAQSPDEYLAIAANLAGNIDHLASLRSGLRDRMGGSAVCDLPRFARDFESALRSMWRGWCDQ